MDREKIIKKFGQDILRIKERGTERSFYPIICSFLEEIIQDKYKNISATVEESLLEKSREIGFPDITIRQNNRLIGWTEVKLPEDSLNDRKFTAQFTRYKDALENIVFTNLREWQLWQWGDEGKPHKVAEINFDPSDFPIGQEIKFFDFLEKFFEGRPYEARTPKQLALALAKKTKLLSHQVEEALTEALEDSDLVRLKNTFEKTLIQDIKPHQFANMIAETVAYSLVLAALEHVRREHDEELTLTSALDYLPANVPILADLYQLVTKVSKSIPTIYQATNILVDQIKAADIEKIYFKLIEHKAGADPVIQFYEPFLQEYDPKEREARGVYYTPKPVVDYIVRSVDHILREKFSKSRGLADESVYLLDPATGTGTFLMSAIQQVYEAIEKENKALGDDIVKKEFQQVVINHILKHFYGFELLVAPYAVAHLKLTLLLEDLDFNFKMTRNDSDNDNDRMKIYLANALDDPQPKESQASYDTLGKIAFPAIPKESEAARKVKYEIPILAIIGNPPYSKITTNMNSYMRSLTNDYKNINGVKIKERGALQLEINLNDDYVKFIAFAQKKIVSNSQGIIAFITNHNYLDNPTLYGMRNNLLKSFSHIYIFNLKGNLKKNTKDKNDENVFNIQQGVCISFFIRTKLQKEAEVYYAEISGDRLSKFGFLLSNSLSSTKFERIVPKSPHFLFVSRDESKENEYVQWPKISDVFPLNSAGIITARDNITINDSEEYLLQIAKHYRDSQEDNHELSQALNISMKKGWDMSRSRKLLSNVSNLKSCIRTILYRPFLRKKIFYHQALVWSMSQPVMRQMDEKNINLIFTRQVTNLDWAHIQVSTSLVEIKANSHDRSSQIAPLYQYQTKKSEDSSLFGTTGRKANLAPDVISEFCRLLRLSYTSSGQGDLIKTFGPEDIFYYTYGILHCPTYRLRYAEQLKIDFPRLPLTSDRKLFRQLVVKGNELVNLHLLGENPFDNTKTIFDDRTKWSVKIGGMKNEDIDDWKVTDVHFDEIAKRIYVNPSQYFDGASKEVWNFFIGGYQVCDKWLKDYKKDDRSLAKDDLIHYMKILVAIRETIRVMNEIDRVITSWPIK